MRILIVDDEADVLQAIMAIVKAVPGHEVKVAANAQKAMDHAAAFGGVDILISDVVMEPTDGFTLRTALQAQYPAMRVIFVSGYDLTDYGEQVGEAAVVPKPVDAMALITEIGRALGHAPVPALVAAAPEKARVAGKTTAITVPAATVRASARAATPVAVSAPVAVPTPAAVPVAMAVPVAVAMPVAAAVPKSGIVAQPQAVAAAAADPLIGVQLGDYRVQKLIGEGKWGRVYLALQLSVSRRVGLKVLDSAHADDADARAQFLADARAKAAVQHPFIMSVFEADEQNGLAFFTHEFLDGASMGELIARGQKLDEKTALHVLKVAGEGLQYLWSHNLSHTLIGPDSLRLGGDNIARMANIASAGEDPGVTVEGELMSVGTILRQLTSEESLSVGLRMLLGRMTGGPNPVSGWPVVLQAVKALEPKVIPVEAAKMKAADAAAMRAVEADRRAKKKALIINISTLSVLLIGLGFVIWKFAISNARTLDMQVTIPAGTYNVGEAGSKATLPAFEIDKYEVTIGEYAKFIAWCEQNSGREHEFDHPRGDKKTQHVNLEVQTLILNASQRGRRVFHQDAVPARKLAEDPGAAVDLNCPMVAVTFWDAYAYAQWRGKIVDKDGIPRDLPTEEEWEAAARGTKGYKYPWGDELKPKNFNSNAGYNALQPGTTKTDDGYNFWSPVDAFSGDVSEFKVVGMAGNVCEWVYRKEGANKEIPLLKGGSFASDPIPMSGRVTKIPADDALYVHPAADKKFVRPGMAGETYFVGDDVTPTFRALYVGFRTVKRK